MSKVEKAVSGPEGVFPAARAGARRGQTLLEAARAQGGIGARDRRADVAAIEIGDFIRSTRRKRGLTQEQLAAAAGLTQGALSEIERGLGRDGPSYRVLRGLCAALGVEPPLGAASAASVVFERGSAGVRCSSAHYWTYAPLFSAEELQALRRYVSEKIPHHVPVVGAFTECVLVRLDADSGEKTVRLTGGPMVVTPLEGSTGIYRFRKALARRQWREAHMREPLGIVAGDGYVTMQPGSDEDMSVMLIPAHALMDEERERA